MLKHSRQMAFGLFFVVTLALMGSGLPPVFSNRAVSKVSTREKNCSEVCGDTVLPYPFYTKSSACGRDGFKLECYKNSTLKIKVGKYLYNVTIILKNGIIIDIMRFNCSPNLERFRIEGTQNYAISRDNFIQFSSCKNRTTCKLANCNFPYESVVQCKVVNPCCFSLIYDQTWVPGVTSFDRFSEWQCTKFISWGFPGVTNWTSIPGLKLEWGIPGNCKSFSCDKNARCEEARYVEASVRCTCKSGYQGDGYIEGTGCVEGVIASAIFVFGITFLQARVVREKRRNSRKSKSQLASLLPRLRQEFTTHLFTYQTLYKATKGFNDAQKCGQGAFGTVYVGCLTDGRHVAVKRLHNTDTFSQNGPRQFLNEISLLSNIEHPNLVHLLGCCLELESPILVYEFVPNGTLAQHLHQQRGDSLLSLDWRSRCNIAVDASEALAYLHSLNPPVYHRDVKSSNILLDFNFNCKVGDFGLSRVGPFDDGTHISTAPQGTPGYLDPEYNQTYQLTDKSDVYSFGVVLIEIITAMKPVDFAREKKEINLAALAVAKIMAHSLDDIIDPSLKVTLRPRVRTMVQRIAELAFRCLSTDKDNRPTMREVAQELLAVRSDEDLEFEDLFHTPASESPMKSASSSKSLLALWSSIGTVNSDSTIPSESPHFDSSKNSAQSDS